MRLSRLLAPILTRQTLGGGGSAGSTFSCVGAHSQFRQLHAASHLQPGLSYCASGVRQFPHDLTPCPPVQGFEGVRCISGFVTPSFAQQVRC